MDNNQLEFTNLTAKESAKFTFGFVVILTALVVGCITLINAIVY